MCNEGGGRPPYGNVTGWLGKVESVTDFARNPERADAKDYVTGEGLTLREAVETALYVLGDDEPEAARVLRNGLRDNPERALHDCPKCPMPCWCVAFPQDCVHDCDHAAQEIDAVAELLANVDWDHCTNYKGVARDALILLGRGVMPTAGLAHSPKGENDGR